MVEEVQFCMVICIPLLYMSSMLYLGGPFLIIHYMMMYLRPSVAFILVVLLVVCGGGHIILGVHH